jgi:hypothetical protein
LEQASAPSVAFVEALGVGVLKRMHACGHVRTRRVDQQMEMVSHRASRVDPPAVAVDHACDELAELVVVDVASEEIFRSRRMSGDVVEPVGEARSQRPRHVFDGSADWGPISSPRENRHELGTHWCRARAG